MTQITIVEDDWKALDLSQYLKLTKAQLIEQISFYIAIVNKMNDTLNNTQDSFLELHGQASRNTTK